MSLLCDYSDSSSSDDDEQQVPQQQQQPHKAPQQQGSLPSAEELFATDTSLTLSCSNSISVAQRSYATETFGSANGSKRRLEQDASAAKRPKPQETTSAAPVASGSTNEKKKPTTHFAPPQLRRPNVSTEDLGAWNTQKTLALQRKAKSQQTPMEP